MCAGKAAGYRLAESRADLKNMRRTVNARNANMKLARLTEKTSKPRPASLQSDRRTGHTAYCSESQRDIYQRQRKEATYRQHKKNFDPVARGFLYDYIPASKCSSVIKIVPAEQVCVWWDRTQMNVCTAWFGLAAPRTISHRASVSRLPSSLLPEFNFGAFAAQDTVNFLGFETGHRMKRVRAARMQRRVQNSMKYVKGRRTERRDKVRAAKLKRLEELLVLEGGPAYAAGQFWSVGGVLQAVGHLHKLYSRYCVFLFWISSGT